MSQLAVKCEVILSRRHHMPYINRLNTQILDSNSARKYAVLLQTLQIASCFYTLNHQMHTSISSLGLNIVNRRIHRNTNVAWIIP